MATTYLFLAEFTKSKVKTTPANAPTIDIVDALAPTGALLVTAASPTQFTNMTGVYVYSYAATSTTKPVGVMRTADTTVDLQDIPCYPIPFDANGNVLVSLQAILGTLLTETSGQIAAAFIKFFNKATPTGTINSIPDVVAGVSGGLPLAVDSSGRVDIAKWLGTNVTLSSGVPDVNIKTVTAGIIAAASFASNALDAVWSTATRLLTAGTNIVLAKGTGVTGFNDLSSINVASAVLDATATSYNTAGTIGKKINDSGSGAGGGSIVYTLTVTDGVNPLDGVFVEVSTDSGKVNVIATGYTLANGTLTLNLDAGSYYFFKNRAGYNFENPELKVVS